MSLHDSTPETAGDTRLAGSLPSDFSQAGEPIGDPAELIPSYAAAGLAVLPLHTMRGGACTCRRGCRTPGKHPLVRNGKDDASTDLGVIAEWFARWPGCNWGVRPPVGVAVLDIDPRNGGDVTLAELQAQHGQLPETLTAITGSGGLHIWLTYNGPARGKLGDGIDVKTNSGYLVAPPSVHESGGVYRWANRRPAEHAPRWVRTILNPPMRPRPYVKPTGTALDPLVRFVADAPPGTRNDRLYWACCRAVADGHDTEPIVAAAVAGGMPEREAMNTARSAERAPSRKARRA
jgi:hypothetical protein